MENEKIVTKLFESLDKGVSLFFQTHSIDPSNWFPYRLNFPELKNTSFVFVASKTYPRSDTKEGSTTEFFFQIIKTVENFLKNHNFQTTKYFLFL